MVSSCLQMLDVVVRYAAVPLDCVEAYSTALCRIVNIDMFAVRRYLVCAVAFMGGMLRCCF